MQQNIGDKKYTQKNDKKQGQTLAHTLKKSAR